jgi:hypothetical protein
VVTPSTHFRPLLIPLASPRRQPSLLFGPPTATPHATSPKGIIQEGVIFEGDKGQRITAYLQSGGGFRIGNDLLENGREESIGGARIQAVGSHIIINGATTLPAIPIVVATPTTKHDGVIGTGDGRVQLTSLQVNDGDDKDGIALTPSGTAFMDSSNQKPSADQSGSFVVDGQRPTSPKVRPTRTINIETSSRKPGASSAEQEDVIVGDIPIPKFSIKKSDAYFNKGLGLWKVLSIFIVLLFIHR